MAKKQNLTIDDIAQALGVSKTTISRAISGKGRISETTRANVMEYIEQHNYRPSAAAKGLAESRTCNLMLILPGNFAVTDSPCLRQIMLGVWEEAVRREYNILLCFSNGTPPAALIHALDNRKIDGAILPYASDNDALTALLLQRQMPFAAVSCIGSDSALVGKTACAELIKYLLDEVYNTDPLPGCHIVPKETA